MVEGRYDLEYVEQRIALGLLYGRVGLPTKVYLGAFRALLAAANGRPRDDIAILVIGASPQPDAADPGTLPGAPRPPEATDG
jgi:hypothetical protein